MAFQQRTGFSNSERTWSGVTARSRFLFRPAYAIDRFRPRPSRAAHPGYSANAPGRALRCRPGNRSRADCGSSSLHIEDVAAAVADGGHCRAQRAGRVLHRTARRATGRPILGGVAAPGNVQPIVHAGLRLFQFGAVDGVNDGALARHHQPDDAVARQRMATIAETIGNAFRQAANGNRLGLARRLGRARPACAVRDRA